MDFLAIFLKSFAEFVASTGTMLCSIIVLEEPEMPKDLIKWIFQLKKILFTNIFFYF